jgi:hypothetical protein
LLHQEQPTQTETKQRVSSMDNTAATFTPASAMRGLGEKTQQVNACVLGALCMRGYSRPLVLSDEKLLADRLTPATNTHRQEAQGGGHKRDGWERRNRTLRAEAIQTPSAVCLLAAVRLYGSPRPSAPLPYARRKPLRCECRPRALAALAFRVALASYSQCSSHSAAVKHSSNTNS